MKYVHTSFVSGFVVKAASGTRALMSDLRLGRTASGMASGSGVQGEGAQARGTASQQSNAADNIKVVVRVRPMTSAELERGEANILTIPEDARSVDVVVPGPRGATMSRNFAFHACLPPSITQPDVFARIGVRQLLEATIAGYACTVLAYGQTGSGKTFTMSGREEVIDREQYQGDEDNDGLITRSMIYLFTRIGQLQGINFVLRTSYLEIYNEQIFDLLAADTPSQSPLPVRWEARRGFFVQGLTQVECRNLEDVFNVVRQGTHNRRVGSHEMNKDSSRSHSVMTCHVESTTSKDGQTITKYGKVSFVDLAGSERLKQSKSAGGTQLKETGSINRSLFALGKVISALGEAKGSVDNVYIPYRDSKLTKLLMDSLGGSSLALMIATCSPAQGYVEETLSTLYYATSAKNIKNKPVVQMDPQDTLVLALRREVQLLRTENTFLREQLAGKATPGYPQLDVQKPYLSLMPDDQGALSPGGNARTPSTSGKSKSGSTPLGETKGRRGTLPSMPHSAELLEKLSQPGDLSGLPKSELMRRLQDATALLHGYAMQNEQLYGEVDQLQAQHSMLQVEHQGVITDNERLEGKLERLETTFMNQSDGTSGAFTIKRQNSVAAVTATHPGFPMSSTVPNTQNSEQNAKGTRSGRK
ncbi:hypothetical protein CYMTET_56226 [Cymbomonas tetramitiformis]|uniref:Kinesin-like protein n=1 Tax=Cymbomonas tetramitiformis TaxID=36881 RepID=A0AAE0BBD4_9CHLO|nr:hypothetical protein CYMTET_56226 [Cymbomonas tetramitiformis]